MAQTQTFETAQAQTPQQFTPEEATQILTDAVNLSSQYLSLAQLEAIADEAGVPRETLYQAIQRRTQRLDAINLARLKKQERRQRWKGRLMKMLRLTLFGVIVYVSFMIGVNTGYNSADQPRYSYPTETLSMLMDGLDYYLEELEPHLEAYAIQELIGKKYSYYVMPYARSLKQGGSFTSIWRSYYLNEPARMVFKTRGQITRASLSEDGKMLAVYIKGSNEGGVWVLDLESGERHRVVTEQGGGGIVLRVDGVQATAYGSEIAWVSNRKLMFSTTLGLFTCEVNERGAPLRYERFDGDTDAGGG